MVPLFLKHLPEHKGCLRSLGLLCSKDHKKLAHHILNLHTGVGGCGGEAIDLLNTFHKKWCFPFETLP